jgi:hypothetical protein
MRRVALRRFANPDKMRLFARFWPRNPRWISLASVLNLGTARLSYSWYPEEVDMTRRDQELLDRQLRGLGIPRRHDGMTILAIVAVFVAGIWLGNLHSEASETAHFNSMQTALSAPSGTNLTVLR